MNAQRWIQRSILQPVKQHSSELLLCAGLASGAAAIGMAILGTVRAVPLVDKRKKELNTEKLPAGEILKTVWKCYIPTVTTAAASAGCLIGASYQYTSKITALTAAYSMSEAALSEYHKKVVEQVGSEKEKLISDAVDAEKITKNPVSKQVVFLTEGGNDLCYDSASGRYFKSSKDAIVRASNIISRVLLDEMYVTLNEFYYELGLDGIDLGRDFGWAVSDGLIELSFGSQLADDGSPCLVLNYSNRPRPDYRTR